MKYRHKKAIKRVITSIIIIIPCSLFLFSDYIMYTPKNVPFNGSVYGITNTDIIEQLDIETKYDYVGGLLEEAFRSFVSDVKNIEYIGCTEYDFKIEVACEAFDIYCIFHRDDSRDYYAVPLMDGKHLRYIYHYNTDKSLTLQWSDPI